MAINYLKLSCVIWYILKILLKQEVKIFHNNPSLSYYSSHFTDDYNLTLQMTIT